LHSFPTRRSSDLLTIRLPNALPYVLSALKITATAAVVGAIVGEFVASQAGLGMVIVNAQTNLNTPVAFAALVWISIVGLSLYGLVALAARRWAPWAEAGSRTPKEDSDEPRAPCRARGRAGGRRRDRPGPGPAEDRLRAEL